MIGRTSGPTRAGSAFLVWLTLALAGAPSMTAAQMKASEPATITQTIDGTVISLEYSRPSLRGRPELWGNEISWGVVWTPGANQATTIESNKDFELNGTPVPAGRYSVWMVVNPEDWEVVLDPRDDLFHTQHPKPADDQIRFPASYRTADYSVETLSWSFPAVRGTGADLRMQWGTRVVDLELKVEPSVRTTLTADEAAPYLGVYHVEVLESQYMKAHEFDLELTLTNDNMVGTIEYSTEFSVESGFVMVADQVFKMAWVMNGEIVEIFDFNFVEFTLDGAGTAASFEVRDQDDSLSMKGTRTR